MTSEDTRELSKSEEETLIRVRNISIYHVVASIGVVDGAGGHVVAVVGQPEVGSVVETLAVGYFIINNDAVGHLLECSGWFYHCCRC